MFNFFKSRKFQRFVLVIIALLVGAVLALAVRNSSSPVTSAVGTVFSPLQKASVFITDKAQWIGKRFRSSGAYIQEIERLRQIIAEYENRIVNYDEMEQKVASYEKMLELKEENPDFVLARGNIIGTDSADMFSSLIIDKGTNDDVSVGDPVVSGNYLVGIVKKTNPSYSVVQTLLSPELNVSALESKTRETAYVTTDIEYSLKGFCMLTGLEKSTAVTPGGIIVTSGIGGVYPKGLIVGKVTEVCESKYDLSCYAVIEPGADVKSIEDVYVITDFEGQGTEELVE